MIFTSRGLRQVVSFSPFLFIRVVDVPSRLVYTKWDKSCFKDFLAVIGRDFTFCTSHSWTMLYSFVIVM